MSANIERFDSGRVLPASVPFCEVLRCTLCTR